MIVIWAFNFIAGKVGLAVWPPLFMMALRFGLVAIVLAPFLKPPRGRWRKVVLLSVIYGSFHFGPLFLGLQKVDAGLVAIAGQLVVPFSALLALVFYGERMGGWQLLGMAVAFVGAYLLAGEPSASTNLASFALVIGASLGWSVANIVIKTLGPMNVFQLNAWIALLACPQLLAQSLIFETGQRQALLSAGGRAWGAVGYMAVGASITAYGLWYHLIAKYQVNRIVPLTLLAPVLAVVLAAVLLGEPMTVGLAAGGACTLGGVAMIEFLRPHRRATLGEG